MLFLFFRNTVGGFVGTGGNKTSRETFNFDKDFADVLEIFDCDTTELVIRLLMAAGGV